MCASPLSLIAWPVCSLGLLAIHGCAIIRILILIEHFKYKCILKLWIIFHVMRILYLFSEHNRIESSIIHSKFKKCGISKIGNNKSFNRYMPKITYLVGGGRHFSIDRYDNSISTDRVCMKRSHAFISFAYLVISKH